MPLKITVLGTGTSQGIPVVACECPVCQSTDQKDKRLRTSVMVQTHHNTFVIDAGPDFRQQMLRENVKKLDTILITHDHKDHIGGIDDVRAFNWVMQKPMNIFATPKSITTIQKDFSYAFEDNRYPGAPQIQLREIDSSPFQIGEDTIIPIKAMHGTLPVVGFRVGDFSYLTDASYAEPEEMNKMKGSKAIIINALRKEKHHSHYTLNEAMEILKELKPEKGYLTHISHQMGLYAEVSKELPKGIEMAWDGLSMEV